MGKLEGSAPASDNDWETIANQGEAAIKNWIGNQMSGKSCVVVLIGSGTAGRKWISYEIEKGWNDGRALVGVYVHGLKNSTGATASMGGNAFSYVSVGGTPLSSVIKCYNPGFSNSQDNYEHIKNNIAGWIETAIADRRSYAA
jgi:hypothetical protein